MTIYELRRGHCKGEIVVNGRRIYRSGPTKTAVRRALEQAEREDLARAGVPPSRRSLAQHLESWVERREAAKEIRASTAAEYTRAAGVVKQAACGSVRLVDVTPTHLEELQAGLVKAGMGARARLAVHQCVRAGLEAAVREGLLASNPATRVARPRYTPGRKTVLTPAQVQALVAAALKSEGPIRPFAVLAAASGLRLGELLGLQWRYVNLEERTLRVEQSLSEATGAPVLGPPKSTRSRREIGLPALVVEELRRWRAERWPGAVPHGTQFVFPDAEGGPLRKSNFARREWTTLIAAAKLPAGTGAHQLRHARASHLLHAGAPVPAVSQLLGHADSSITLRTYAHALPDSKHRLADMTGELLAGAAKAEGKSS